MKHYLLNNEHGHYGLFDSKGDIVASWCDKGVKKTYVMSQVDRRVGNGELVEKTHKGPLPVSIKTKKADA